MRPRRRVSRTTRRHGSAGFTLVEVLVALLLFGLLSLALFGAVHVDAEAWGRATVRAEESGHRIHVQDLLRHLLENAYPLFLPSDPANRHMDFAGSKNALEFLSNAPMALGNGGRSRITLSVEERQDRVELILQSKPELGDENDQPETARKPLVSGASLVAFSYFGQIPWNRPAEWHDDWTDRTELPRLVRIAVRFPQSVGGDWPDLIIAPRITADVGCVLELLTRRCQGR